MYHVELQTDADGSIALRITEYDLLVATRYVRIENGVVKVQFPRTVLIGLRHDAIRREPHRVEVDLPDGTMHSYAIPTISIHDISNDEIFKEALYLLLPFIMFRHERELGELDTKSAGVILWLMDYVTTHLTKRHPAIAERVIEMRGEVLDIPFLKQWHEAEARGRQEGEKTGMFNTLFELVRDGILGVNIAAKRSGLSLKAFNAKMAEYEASLQA